MNTFARGFAGLSRRRRVFLALVFLCVVMAAVGGRQWLQQRLGNPRVAFRAYESADQFMKALQQRDYERVLTWVPANYRTRYSGAGQIQSACPIGAGY